MYGLAYSKSMDQPGKIASPARGQANRKNNISLSAFVPENVVSRDGFGSPVPRPLYKDASCHHNPNMKFQIQILGICGTRFALHVGYPGIYNLEMVMGSDES